MAAPASEPWCRPVRPEERIGRVVIAGGTHGNERNGLYLARSFARLEGHAGDAKHGFDFELTALEVNTAAIQANLRYTDVDLNRCFRLEDLEAPGGGPDAAHYERRRARELNALLGPKSSPTPRADYCFDLHNTTAATGVALFLHPRDKLSQEIAAYLFSIDPLVRCCFWPDREPGLLPSLARSGMTFEVGPVSWGCLDAALYATSKRLLEAGLRYLQAHNEAQRGGPSAPRRERRVLRVHQGRGAVQYPRDSNKELLGMVHSSLQFRDFQPLQAEDPVFAMFDGSELRLRDVEVATGPPGAPGTASALALDEGRQLYPWFVNEAAYYDANLAFVVGEVVEVEVDLLEVGEGPVGSLPAAAAASSKL